jgi:putative ABC transport system permease protein
MWKNHLTVAWRNLTRDKLYSFINILGLALAITSFLGIYLFVIDEYSYDMHHQKADRIYRMWEIIDLEGQGEHSSSLQFPVGPTMVHEYPDIFDQMVRFYNGQQPFHTLQFEENIFNEKGVFFVDTNVFEVFDFRLIKGDPSTVMAKPNSIVLSKKLEQKLFPNGNSIGQEIKFEGGMRLNVTGVLDELPEQTHLDINGMVSFTTLRQFMGNPVQAKNWVWNPCWTYFLLKENASPKVIEAQSASFAEKYFPDFMAKQLSFYLMPLKDIHLTSHLDYEIKPNGNQTTVYILALIGIFILFIGCINFINLSTARSQRRAKEIAVRKTVGGVRAQLIKQFLAESFLHTCIAVAISLSFLEIFLPYFNQLTDKAFPFSFIFQVETIVLILTTIILTTLLSGFYPALFLSRLSPLHIFRNNAAGGKSSIILRKSLVVLQFTISFGLIIATFVVNEQLEYLQNNDPGFSKENILVLNNKPGIIHKYEAFRNELVKHESIIQATRMNDVFGIDHNVHEYNYQGMNPQEWKYFPSLIVDEYFVECFDLKVIAGRNFNDQIRSDDTMSVLINQTMANNLGWTIEEAVGQKMFTPHGKEKVIGVVKDFNYVSFADPIQPFVLDMQKDGRFGGFFNKFTAIKFKDGQSGEVIKHLENIWSDFAPQFPPNYFFLDERMGNQYKDQAILRDIIQIFAIITLLITCIGLFALTSYSLQQRQKEMSVRKIHGASELNLSWIMGKELLWMIIPAFVISSPLAFYFLVDWLNSFAFHTAFNSLAVVFSFALVALISVITLSYHVKKLLHVNLVNILKYE